MFLSKFVIQLYDNRFLALTSDDRAGFFPGAVYLCSFWYMPKHLATRLAVFYCASALSGAFSGLLAAGIAKMSGVGGLEGWRWIFILEGIVTVVLGVLCFFFLIDSPKLSGKWLNQDEIRFLELQHFIKDGGQFQEERKSTSWKDIKAVLGNWRMYPLAYILLAQSACSYGLFLPPSKTMTMANLHKKEPNSPSPLLQRAWASKTQPRS